MAGSPKIKTKANKHIIVRIFLCIIYGPGLCQIAEDDEECQFLLVIMAALQDCKRPSNPIRWFTKESLSSSKDEVKKWIAQNMRKKNNGGAPLCDLITHWECAPGFEVDVGIGVGHYFNNTAIMSRCKGQHIHIM